MLNRRFLISLMPKLRDEIAYETTKSLGSYSEHFATRIKNVN